MKDSILHLDYNVCPICGASVYPGVKQITWDDKKREFNIAITLRCRQCNVGEEMLRKLPLEIANKSQCRCGSILDLADFSVSEVAGDFKLVAKYTCSTCGDKTISQKIKDALSSFWRNTAKVKVSAEGVEYEKASQ